MSGHTCCAHIINIGALYYCMYCMYRMLLHVTLHAYQPPCQLQLNAALWQLTRLIFHTSGGPHDRRKDRKRRSDEATKEEYRIKRRRWIERRQGKIDVFKLPNQPPKTACRKEFCCCLPSCWCCETVPAAVKHCGFCLLAA